MEKGCTLCVAAGDPCVRHPKYKNCGKCTLWGKTCSLNPECPAFRHNSMMVSCLFVDLGGGDSADNSLSAPNLLLVPRWTRPTVRSLSPRSSNGSTSASATSKPITPPSKPRTTDSSLCLRVRTSGSVSSDLLDHRSFSFVLFLVISFIPLGFVESSVYLYIPCYSYTV